MIKKQIEILFSYVQTPTPSEVSWFKKEVSEFKKLRAQAWLNRVNLFENTPECQKIVLHGHLPEIRSLLNTILKQNLTIQHEMSAWSNLSLKFFDERLFRKAFQELSVKASYFPGNMKELNPICYYDSASDQYPFPCGYMAWGRYIHKVIVNKYLESLISIKKQSSIWLSFAKNVYFNL